MITKLFLTEALSSVGEVLLVDETKAYIAKLSGPRARILVDNIDHLPMNIIIPRIGGSRTLEYGLEYSCFPSQCERCKSFDHLVSRCPVIRRTLEERYPDRSRNKEQPSAGTDPTNKDQVQAPAPTRHQSLPVAQLKWGPKLVWHQFPDNPVPLAV